MSEEIEEISFRPYVKIGTSSDGDALVQVMAETGALALESYTAVVNLLRSNGFTVANDKANAVKISNDNTKFNKTVTVSGKGESVSKQWMEEMAK